MVCSLAAAEGDRQAVMAEQPVDLLGGSAHAFDLALQRSQLGFRLGQAVEPLLGLLYLGLDFGRCGFGLHRRQPAVERRPIIEQALALAVEMSKMPFLTMKDDSAAWDAASWLFTSSDCLSRVRIGGCPNRSRRLSR
jgi:hypothetical protein